jgi:hypothetical protein
MSSNCWSLYKFYLKSPITTGAIERIYERISVNPNFTLSHTIDDCIAFTKDNVSFRADREIGDSYCELNYRDRFTISLRDPYLPDGEERGSFSYPIVSNGARQFEVLFYKTKAMMFYYLEDGDFNVRAEIIPLLSTIVEELDPFLGIFGHEGYFEGLDDEEDPEGWDEFVDMMGNLNWAGGHWASFYFDNDMLRDIGSKPIQQWSRECIPVRDLGMFIERDEKPLCGGMAVRDHDEAKRKTTIYKVHIYPTIIKRMEKEYGFD